MLIASVGERGRIGAVKRIVTGNDGVVAWGLRNPDPQVRRGEIGCRASRGQISQGSTAKLVVCANTVAGHSDIQRVSVRQEGTGRMQKSRIDQVRRGRLHGAVDG